MVSWIESFQHEPYLLTFNVDHDTHISNVLKSFEPLGIYAGKDHEAKDSCGFDNLNDGAVIAVPNDATNRGTCFADLRFTI